MLPDQNDEYHLLEHEEFEQLLVLCPMTPQMFDDLTN
jgi:hypothetical protein